MIIAVGLQCNMDVLCTLTICELRVGWREHLRERAHELRNQTLKDTCNTSKAGLGLQIVVKESVCLVEGHWYWHILCIWISIYTHFIFAISFFFFKHSVKVTGVETWIFYILLLQQFTSKIHTSQNSAIMSLYRSHDLVTQDRGNLTETANCITVQKEVCTYSWMRGSCLWHCEM